MMRAEPTFPPDFQNRIADLRYGVGLSQRELAKKLRVDRLTIMNWECGRTYPPFWNLLEIARFFNVDLNWLMGHSVLEKAA